jgi:restriction system protein
MIIPDYQTIMLPLLNYAKDGKPHSLHNAVDDLATIFKLSESEKRELLPSGKQPIFENRVGWARTYLKKARLLDSTQRGYFCITERGKIALNQNLSKIDGHFLDQFEEFREFKQMKREKPSQATLNQTPAEQTPLELLDNAYQKISDSISYDLLQTVKSCSPSFFEKLVIDLLLNMGYGGSRAEAGQTIGSTGDEGIDGIIKEDRLGLDIIYIQAKRWEGVVGRPEIQKFAGALQGQRAHKGIFITTSYFSKEANEFAEDIDRKIILIDGRRLTELMIEYNVGVSPMDIYELKRIDNDCFSEE